MVLTIFFLVIYFLIAVGAFIEAHEKSCGKLNQTSSGLVWLPMILMSLAWPIILGYKISER